MDFGKKSWTGSEIFSPYKHSKISFKYHVPEHMILTQTEKYDTLPHLYKFYSITNFKYFQALEHNQVFFVPVDSLHTRM